MGEGKIRKGTRYTGPQIKQLVLPGGIPPIAQCLPKGRKVLSGRGWSVVKCFSEAFGLVIDVQWR